MDKAKEVFAYFVMAMSMFALLCAVYQAMHNQLQSAGILGGIFIAGALLAYLPQLETFKAFGVEARMQKTLDRADDIIARLKTLSAVNGKATYALLAWGNRAGNIPFSEKQTLADEIDRQLSSIGVAPSEIEDLKRDYVRFIGFDMSQYYDYVLPNIVSASRPQPDRMPEWTKAYNSSGRMTFEKIGSLNGDQLAAALKAEIPKDILKPEDVAKLEAFADRIGGVYTTCLKRRGYSREAIDFFKEFEPLYGNLSAFVAHVMG